MTKAMLAKNALEATEALAAVDPRVAIFTVGVVCVLTLGAMALGYDADISIFGNGMRFAKSGCERDD